MRWPHFDFDRMNIEPIIVTNQIEDRMNVLWFVTSSGQSCSERSAIVEFAKPVGRRVEIAGMLRATDTNAAGHPTGGSAGRPPST